jgi:acyl dehydratase
VLTCQSKAPRTPEQGEVRWDVQVLDQDDAVVASYELLTMVRASQHGTATPRSASSTTS